MGIKDYHIEMLSVGAADAFIIYIIDENDSDHIVMIDSGNYGDGDKIIKHIRTYYLNNPRIDVAIVTHPDKDHYGGFIYMLELLANGSKEAIEIDSFWINDPGNNHIDVGDVKNGRKQAPVNYRAQRVYDLNDLNLIDLIDELGILREEKFADIVLRKSLVTNKLVFNFVPSGFPGFTIIGPTKTYYEQLITNFRDDLIHHYDDDKLYDSNSDIQSVDCLSPTLDNAADDSSAHNQSSIMILFEPKIGKKYFFMGDAGRDAFDNIPHSHKVKIKGVSWLKVPHHGSKHNMDSTMINWLNPKTAYISSEKIGNYVNRCTINALKRSGCKVYSTHIDGNHLIHKQVGEREGYSTATPL